MKTQINKISYLKNGGIAFMQNGTANGFSARVSKNTTVREPLSTAQQDGYKYADSVFKAHDGNLNIVNNVFKTQQRNGGVIKYQHPAGPLKVKLPSIPEQSRIYNNYVNTLDQIHPLTERDPDYNKFSKAHRIASLEYYKYSNPVEGEFRDDNYKPHLFDEDAINKYDSIQKRVPVSRQMITLPNINNTGFNNFFRVGRKNGTYDTIPNGISNYNKPAGKVIKLQGFKKGGLINK